VCVKGVEREEVTHSLDGHRGKTRLTNKMQYFADTTLKLPKVISDRG
jgi:hypothetical protein